MIVLDTNIISEPSKLRPDRTVLAWLNRTPKQQQFLTVLTVAELSAGGHRTFLKSGSRKYLDTLASIYRNLGRASEAEPLAKRSQAIRDASKAVEQINR